MSESTWNDLIAAHRRAAVGPTDSVPEHQPRAAILACSDARVPPSVVFDQEAGALFVVRIAGNTASPAALASLDYAVAELGVELLIVLGHTGCGAVAAAASGTCGGHLTPIVEPICEIVKSMPDAPVELIAERNVATAVATLTDHSGPVGVAARAGRLEIRGAVHDLRSGRLRPVPTDSPTENRSQPTPNPALMEAT